MKIETITPEENDTLLSIYKNNPVLSLQNNGYEYIRKSDLTDLDKAKIKEIEGILKKSIAGFSSFSNFRLNKNQEIQIRFQYNYNYDPKNGLPFTGVGYILLDELLNGFRN